MSAALPTPLSGKAVKTQRVPERLVAVKTFPSLVLEEEISRQEKSLLSVLPEAEVHVLNKIGVSVLQYNPPFTVPWRRRNGIAVVLEKSGDGGEAAEKDALAMWKSCVAATL